MNRRNAAPTAAAAAIALLIGASALGALPTVGGGAAALAATGLQEKTATDLSGADTPGSAAEAKKLAASAPDAAQFPNAAKATLLDLADITVRPDGSSRTVTRMTVKVFNERGREAEGEVRLPYEQGRQTITVVFARTIRPDGSVVVVKPEDIHDQGYDEGDNSYTDARVKAFSMPALEPGAIVDYQYITEEKAPYIEGQFWTQWYFANLDPVKHSRLTITLPKAMKLREDLDNTSIKGRKEELPDGQSVRYTWEMKDIDPLELEPMMPDPSRYLPQLHVSTLPSWQSVADLYWTLSKDRMVANEEIKRITADLIKGKNSPEEKAKAIFYYVEEKTRYVAKELGIGAIQPRPAALTCENKYGDCKDMTTLLVAMLGEAGIKAHPVLLKAGSKAPIREDLPGLNAFNHAICLAEIGGKKFWLDATAQICPWGEIPGADRGCDAFVIRDGKGQFETIPHFTPEENQQSLSAKLDLNPDGSAKGKITITGTGDVNMALRGTLIYLPPDKIKPVVERIAQGLAANARVTDYRLSDFRDKDKPVTIEMDVTFPSWAKKSGDLLVFNARPEQVGGGTSTPFGPDTIRRTPITQENSAMGKSVLELTLPPGFTVLAVPDAADVKSDIGHYTRSVSVTGNTLTIQISGKDFRGTIPPNRYGEVQSYFDRYLKAVDESVVVKKM